MSVICRDLFGEPIAAAAALRKERRRRKVGYADKPGSGPKGKRCGNCKHCSVVVHRGQRSKKCDLMAHAWTHSDETDIHPQAPACKQWERRPFSPAKHSP